MLQTEIEEEKEKEEGQDKNMVKWKAKYYFSNQILKDTKDMLKWKVVDTSLVLTQFDPRFGDC